MHVVPRGKSLIEEINNFKAEGWKFLCAAQNESNEWCLFFEK